MKVNYIGLASVKWTLLMGTIALRGGVNLIG